MDILDIFLTFLLKPPQLFIGLFLTLCSKYFQVTIELIEQERNKKRLRINWSSPKYAIFLASSLSLICNSFYNSLIVVLSIY